MARVKDSVAEAVDKLVGEVVRLLLGADERDTAVDVHALLCRGDVALRDVLGVGEALASLLLDATLNEIACCWVDRNLT